MNVVMTALKNLEESILDWSDKECFQQDKAFKLQLECIEFQLVSRRA